MAVLGDRLRAFVAFAQGLKGDEKGEAQTYVDRLMRAFGHGGAIEAGGTFERRIKGERSTLFADYELPGRFLELSYTAHEFKPFAEALGNASPPGSRTAMPISPATASAPLP